MPGACWIGSVRMCACAGTGSVRRWRPRMNRYEYRMCPIDWVFITLRCCYLEKRVKSIIGMNLLWSKLVHFNAHMLVYEINLKTKKAGANGKKNYICVMNKIPVHPLPAPLHATQPHRRSINSLGPIWLRAAATGAGGQVVLMPLSEYIASEWGFDTIVSKLQI